jgi:ABC-type phosphate transport system auxiliary subunit
MKKTKKTTKASKKVSKIDKLSQVHGKKVEQEYEPTTLDQIWGDDGTGRYGTMEIEEYKAEIDQMSRTDINAHAAQLGVIPVEDRMSLEKRLTDEFTNHVNSYRKPLQKRVEDPSLEQKVKDLLKD